MIPKTQSKMIKVRTVRQVKQQQQRPRNRKLLASGKEKKNGNLYDLYYKHLWRERLSFFLSAKIIIKIMINNNNNIKYRK